MPIEHRMVQRHATTRRVYAAMPANTYTMVPVRAWKQCERCGLSENAIDFFGWDNCRATTEPEEARDE